MVCQSCGRKLKDTTSLERLHGRSHKSRCGSQVGCKKSKSPQVEENINIPGQMSIEDYPEFML